MAERLVARIDEIPTPGTLVVAVGGEEIGLVRIGDQVRAYENRCVHQGGPVCRGEVIGKLEVILDEGKRVVGERFSERELHLVCPWHGWEYDALTGECAADRSLRLRRIPVSVRGDEVFVSLDGEPTR